MSSRWSAGVKRPDWKRLSMYSTPAILSRAWIGMQSTDSSCSWCTLRYSLKRGSLRAETVTTGWPVLYTRSAMERL